jgi:hypothetical protein
VDSSSRTAAIGETQTCRVRWCDGHERGRTPEPDHYADSADDGPWPGVVATGDASRQPYVVQPLPHWGVSVGLDPVVALYLSGGTDTQAEPTIDLRPSEARRLARLLTQAADAVEATQLQALLERRGAGDPE